MPQSKYKVPRKQTVFEKWNRRFAAPLEQAIRKVAETGILPDGDHINGSTQMWLAGLLAEQGCDGCRHNLSGQCRYSGGCIRQAVDLYEAEQGRKE